MFQISHSHLTNLFLNVRVAAHCAGTTIGQLREETKRVRLAKRHKATRSEQATIFAKEEAQLHEQVMIEQVLLLERLQREQEASRRQAEQIAIAATTNNIKQKPTGDRIVLTPTSTNQNYKVEAIDQKLAVIRRRMAPSKNAAGIAVLQAAVAGY
jgi:hypothetical protein